MKEDSEDDVLIEEVVGRGRYDDLSPRARCEALKKKTQTKLIESLSKEYKKKGATQIRVDLGYRDIFTKTIRRLAMSLRDEFIA